MRLSGLDYGGNWYPEPLNLSASFLDSGRIPPDVLFLTHASFEEAIRMRVT